MQVVGRGSAQAVVALGAGYEGQIDLLLTNVVLPTMQRHRPG